MTGNKEQDTSWRHTSVIVRADIYSKAHEQGIDISNVCNTALADLLGITYHKQQLDDVPAPRPVIIAQNSPPPETKEHGDRDHLKAHSPVINADDPAASISVRNIKRQPKVRPELKAADQGTAPIRKKEEPVPLPTANTAPAGRARQPAAGKTQKNEGLKKFVSTKIARSDTDDAVCSKDDMYQAFTRFCNEYKYTPVPDRKTFTIALKNKFAFFDKTINGVPSWINVRLK